MVGHVWLVTALNPKSITFFVAFVPQFVDHTLAFAPQAAIMVATFVVLAFANAFGYALIATRARQAFANPRAIRIFNRAGGTLLVGAGVATAAMRN
jgi:threonine/homoserine/homoserine lactone efflux protein